MEIELSEKKRAALHAREKERKREKEKERKRERRVREQKIYRSSPTILEPPSADTFSEPNGHASGDIPAGGALPQ